MTQALGVICNHLLSRLVVMKKEIAFHERLTDTYVNEADVIEKLQERYNEAVKAYEILNGLVTDGYMTDGNWVEPDYFD